MYTHNDSGSGPEFFMSDIDGSNLKRVLIENFTPKDTEDMAIANCFSNKTCLYIADIGDNRESRNSVQIVIIEEQNNFGASVKPNIILNLIYPYKPHNAESIAVTKNGDIFILTKNSKDYGVAVLFKISKDKYLENANQNKLLVLEKISEIDLPLINSKLIKKNQIATSMNISEDESSFIVMTYENAIEFNFDLNKNNLKSTKDMIEGKDYFKFNLSTLPKMESITYTNSDFSVLYTSEANGFSDIAIMQQDCNHRIQ